MNMRFLIGLICVGVATVFGADVRIAWDAEPGSAGYRMHIGTNSRTYTTITNFSNAGTNIVSGLQQNRTYYFAVTTISTNGMESDYSNEVSGQPRPAPPKNLMIITNTIQTSESLQGPWRDETNLMATLTTETNRFVRVKAAIAKQ